MDQNLIFELFGMELRILRTGISFLFILLFNQTIGQITFEYDSSVVVKEEDSILKNPWTGGLNSGQYGRIDINGDQKEDLIIFDRSSKILNTFVLKEGMFIYNPDYRFFFPKKIEGWILFRDYDCDGRKDIFTNASRGMKVYRNITPEGSNLKWELIADPVLTLTSSGLINLQVNITDVPAIDDVDGDGDLDILVYNFALGGFIRYHQNMSIENTGSCGSIEYELVNRQWGYFEECDCMLYAFLEYGESCQDFSSGRIMHAGGKSLLLIDMDNDGDKDFLGGHEQCDELYYLENVGTSEEAKMINFRIDFPTPDRPSNFHIHPAAYFEDFDLDGIKDLVVAPNEQFNSDNQINFKNSSWLYKNIGTNELPEFSFVTETFIQSSMIDMGENAVPSLVDFEGDGDLDLIIGGHGKKMGNEFYGYMRVYENTGNFLDPVFSLKNSDYLGLSSLKWYNFLPVFADLNHDGAIDMILNAVNPGNYRVESRLYVNQNKPGRGLKFETTEYIALDLGAASNDTPFFTDVNNDGLNDMLLGKSTGRLEYHINSGKGEDPVFILEDPAFLGIDDDFITFKRNLVPFVFDFNLDGKDDLITSDYTGVFTVYESYKEQPVKMSEILYNQISQTADTTSMGYHSWFTSGILFLNEYPVLLVGGISGGIVFLRSAIDREIDETDKFIFTIYPNPLIANDMLNVRSNRDGILYIYNYLGQALENPLNIKGYEIEQFEIGNLPQGIYIFQYIDYKGNSSTQKLIKY